MDRVSNPGDDDRRAPGFERLLRVKQGAPGQHRVERDLAPSGPLVHGDGHL